MPAIRNRKELTTVFFDEKQQEICHTLEAAGIPYEVRRTERSAAATCPGGCRVFVGVPGIPANGTVTRFIFYVEKQDLERARAALEGAG